MDDNGNPYEIIQQIASIAQPKFTGYELFLVSKFPREMQEMMRYKMLTAQRDDLIIRAYQAHYSISAIARSMGIGRKAVQHVINITKPERR